MANNFGSHGKNNREAPMFRHDAEKFMGPPPVEQALVNRIGRTHGGAWNLPQAGALIFSPLCESVTDRP